MAKVKREIIFFKDFIYLFFRELGREGEGEWRNIDVQEKH